MPILPSLKMAPEYKILATGESDDESGNLKSTSLEKKNLPLKWKLLICGLLLSNLLMLAAFYTNRGFSGKEKSHPEAVPTNYGELLIDKRGRKACPLFFHHFMSKSSNWKEKQQKSIP